LRGGRRVPPGCLMWVRRRRSSVLSSQGISVSVKSYVAPSFRVTPWLPK
jgi:hypothetical protein